MPDLPIILLADADEARATAIRETLEREFIVSVVWVSTWVRVEKEIKDPMDRFVLILLSEDLPKHENWLLPGVDYYTQHLQEQGWPHVVVVYSGAKLEQKIAPGTSATRFPAPEFVSTLGAFLPGHNLLLKASLESGAAFREQLRDLDIDQHDQKRSIRILEQLVARFFDWPTVKVGQLTPGLSGAQVFRIEGDRKYVLKLVRDTDRWKLEQEVKRNPLVPGGVANVRLNKPGLKECRYREKGRSPHIASHGRRWCAVCYDYLGGQEFGDLLDLYTVLTAPPAKLPAEAEGGLENFRRMRLAKLVGWLCHHWYEKGAERKTRKIWDTRHRNERQYDGFPPYRLAARRKSAILGFLHSEEATLLGPRRMNDWDEHKKRVWRFVSDGTCPPGLKGELSMVLSAAHGDLNSRNAFLWEDYLDQPFLIDFPMFQPRGHALQDFARLEVEIKIVLMDQQTGTVTAALPALAWTWEQLDSWRQLEDHLLSVDWENDFTCMDTGTGPPCAENVKLSFELVRDLRKHARKVQRQLLRDAPDFPDEYRPALLYHTLRAITYSAPIFKRLLAVYSASRLLQQAGLK